MSDNIIRKFEPILKSIDQNVLLQTSWMESMFMTDSLLKDNIEKQTGFFEDLINRYDRAERNRERDRNLEDIDPPSPSGDDQGSRDRNRDLDQPDTSGLGSLLKASILAPFAFSFVKGFLTEITDGLIELTPSGVLAALRLPSIVKMFGNIGKSFLDLEKIANGPIGKTINTAKGLILSGSEKLSKIFNPIVSVFKGADNIMGGVFGKTLEFFTGGVGKVAGLFGKLIWPFSIIMGVIDAVSAFRETEGTLLEKIGAGIGGFLGEIVGAPLDLLKNAVNWILKKFFGIEVDENGNATSGQGLMGWVVTKLNNFSFEETIGSIVSGIFSVVQGAIDWVGELFTDPTEALKKLWEGYIGVWSGIGQWIYDNAVDPAWSWFKGLFDWSAEDEDSGDTNLISNIFNDTIESIKKFFTDLFDFIPTLDEIKDSLTSMMPVWMRPETVEQERARLEQELQATRERKQRYDSKIPRQRKGRDPQFTIDEIQKQLAELPQLKAGGIFDAAASGSPAMLHGQEAVIPLESSRGQQILQEKTNLISSEGAKKAAAAPVVIKGGDTTMGGSSYQDNKTITQITNINDPSRALDFHPNQAR